MAIKWNGSTVLTCDEGFGYHADFITGWEEDFLQQAVDTCTNPSGMISDCPLFDVVSEAKAEMCEMKLPSLIADEDVLGPLSKLPGGVKITLGGDSDDDDDDEAASTTSAAKPVLTYAPGVVPEHSESPLPGQIFKETSVEAAPAQATTLIPAVAAPVPTSAAGVEIAAAGGVFAEASAEPPATTAAPEIAPVGDGAGFISTEYVTKGNIVSKILWQEEVVYETVEDDVTTTLTVGADGVPPAAPVRRRRRSHLHAHNHRRHN